MPVTILGQQGLVPGRKLAFAIVICDYTYESLKKAWLQGSFGDVAWT